MSGMSRLFIISCAFIGSSLFAGPPTAVLEKFATVIEREGVVTGKVFGREAAVKEAGHPSQVIDKMMTPATKEKMHSLAQPNSYLADLLAAKGFLAKFKLGNSGRRQESLTAVIKTENFSFDNPLQYEQKFLDLSSSLESVEDALLDAENVYRPELNRVLIHLETLTETDMNELEAASKARLNAYSKVELYKFVTASLRYLSAVVKDGYQSLLTQQGSYASDVKNKIKQVSFANINTLDPTMMRFLEVVLKHPTGDLAAHLIREFNIRDTPENKEAFKNCFGLKWPS